MSWLLYELMYRDFFQLLNLKMAAEAARASAATRSRARAAALPYAQPALAAC
jgi:hypothetical protein